MSKAAVCVPAAVVLYENRASKDCTGSDSRAKLAVNQAGELFVRICRDVDLSENWKLQFDEGT